MTLDGTRTIRHGDWVRCEREAPAKGTWARYAGRVGRVVTINRADHEYGVRFTVGGGAGEPITWFRADELISITRPPGAPRIMTDSEWRQQAAERSASKSEAETALRSKCSAPTARNGGGQ